jgi:hypothetical protein
MRRHGGLASRRGIHAGQLADNPPVLVALAPWWDSVKWSKAASTEEP